MNRTLSVFMSLMLILSLFYPAGALAEGNKKGHNSQGIGKDYDDIKVAGKWQYNDENREFSWELDWNEIVFAKQYKVYRKLNDGNFKLIASINNRDKVTRYIDNDFEFGELYSYKVNYIHGNREIELSNVVEIGNELDSDQDNLEDVRELMAGTDPYSLDTDSDGLTDGFELLILGTIPLIADTDDDGVRDADEDGDKDGLKNKKEQAINTDPTKLDTDSDGLNDGEESSMNTSPVKYDSDNDNLSDGEEGPLGFDPTKIDTDNDGINDGDETVAYKTT
ncbi:hypothetical protein ACOI1D_21040, partial [Virgibacillus sp. DJP39]